MQNFFFVLVYIISFVLILKPDVEMFGLGLFFVINVLYGIMTASSLTSSFDDKGPARTIYTYILLAVLVFSLVASILLTMTLFNLQKKFIENKTKMNLSSSTREELSNTEIIFITLIVCSWVLNFYANFEADDVFSATYKIFNTLFNGKEMDWIRLIFPVAVLGLGAAVYGRLDFASIQVNKTPPVYCFPDDEVFGGFKSHFITLFWLLFGYVMSIVLRPFLESYGFSIPYKLYEFFTGNPITGNFFGKNSAIFGVNPKIPFSPLRWDVFYLIRTALALSALVYASYCIQDINTIPSSHGCMYKDAYIRELFIAFIFFLMVLFFVNTLTAYQLSSLLTGIMRYVVPVASLALSGTLVYFANDLSKLSPMQLVE